MNIEPLPYRDEHDLKGMQDVLVEGRKAAGPVYYVHTGDLAWWLFYLDPDFKERVFLWKNESDGSVLGWVLFSPRFRAFDVFVHPDPSLQEQRESLFTWAEEQMSRTVREQGGKDVRTMWVSEHDSLLIAHLESRGFGRSDTHLIALQQPLDEVAREPVLPQGCCVRHVAGEHEAARRAAASHAAFESSKPIERYTEGYVRFMRSSVYTPELDLVAAAPGGQFAAFCICWLDEVNRVGYFEPVGTHPDLRQRGLGKAVLREGLRRMKARGMRTASVCVESDNPAGQKLYAAAGFHKMHRIHTYVKEL